MRTACPRAGSTHTRPPPPAVPCPARVRLRACVRAFVLVCVRVCVRARLPDAPSLQVHNRNTKLQPYQFSHKVWTPSRREATRGDLSSDRAASRAARRGARRVERHRDDFLL